jgi:hypothetical protein
MNEPKQPSIELAVAHVASQDDALRLLREGRTLIAEIGSLRAVAQGNTWRMGNTETNASVVLDVPTIEALAESLLLFGDPDNGAWYVFVSPESNGTKLQ